MTQTGRARQEASSRTNSSREIWRMLLDTTGNRYRLLIVLTIITAVMALASPDKFLSVRNFTSMGFQFPELGIFALAIMISLLTGGIDLSVVSIANLSGILAALLLTQAIPEQASGPVVALWVLLAMATALITGIICGILNGYLIARIRITPILATLGTMQLFAGMSYIITKGPAIHGYPQGFLVLGNGALGPIPIPLLVFAAVAVATTLLLNKTVLGVSLALMGTNETAARFSGINVDRALLKAYMISGLLAGTAGLLMIARTNSAKADYGSSYLLQAVLVAILGGVDPKGGFATVLGICLSVLCLQFLSSGFSMLRFSNFTTEFAWGALLLLVMVINYLCHQSAVRLKDRQLGR